MADVIGMSDVSTPDTGKGSQLKTGGRRTNNMSNKDRCKDFPKLGYKTKSDCMNYGKKKMDKSKKNNWRNQSVVAGGRERNLRLIKKEGK